MSKSSKRGGFRAGAGRKPVSPEDKMISISFALGLDLRDSVDERAHLEGINRSQLLRRYAEEGLARKARLKKKKGSKNTCRKIPKT